MENYNSLTLCIKSDNHLTGNDYRYLVYNNMINHTAFRTKRGLKLWMERRGLTIGKRKAGRLVEIDGRYIKEMLMIDTKEFFERFSHLEPITVLSNGSYVVGFLERKAGGRPNVIYFQNPNTDRIILDYKTEREYLDGKNETRKKVYK